MSVIEKLDGVLALVAQAFDMPVRWSANGNIVPVVYTDDCEIAAVYSDREDDECPDKAAAIIAAVNYFRDHGPAIRQAMIDAERWRYLKDECTSHYGDGYSEPKEAHLYLEWGQGPWIRDGSNGGRGRPDVFPGWDAIVDEMMANAASELADLDDAAIDARLASDSATGEGEGHD